MTDYPYGAYKPMKIVKTFIYRGFRINIYDNVKYAPLRYEWEVIAISYEAIKICLATYRGRNVFKFYGDPKTIMRSKSWFYRSCDPTSNYMPYAIFYAKCEIEGMLNPLRHRLEYIDALNKKYLPVFK